MAGQPTKYKPEYDVQVEKLCKLGATDKEIADFFDVSESTVNNWKHAEPSFLESIKSGKLVADMEVANSLHKRATGYSIKDNKIFQYQGEPVVIPYIKHVEPDTGAAMAWLKNRRPKEWRDRQDVSMDIKSLPSINIGK